MVEVIIKLVSGNLNALRKICCLLQLQELQNIFESWHGFVLSETGSESGRVVDEVDRLLRQILENRFEVDYECPLDAVLDQVGEHFDCAHFVTLFRLVLRVAIANSLVGNNHLRICLCAESARF